jgi:hypothetical protein
MQHGELFAKLCACVTVIVILIAALRNQLTFEKRNV